MAEVAGFVLAVLPLLISAIEHYEDVYRPFSRYKNFEPQTKKVQQALLTERTIFRNECSRLLGSSVDGSVARAMLGDVSHAGWTDEALSGSIDRWLGDSRDGCIAAVTAIQEQLEEIERTCENFGIIVRECTSLSIPAHPRRQAWKLKAKKLKYCFGEAGLEAQLQKLRIRNQSFYMLSQQTIELAEPRCEAHLSNKIESKVAGEYKAIQEASEKLYEALSAACECHDQHSIHVRLDTHHDWKPTRTRFKLGLRSGGHQVPRWMNIDSVPRGAKSPKSPDPNADLQLISSLINMCTKRNICGWLEQHFQEDEITTVYDQCLGYLEIDSKYRHLLYVAPEQFAPHMPDTKTLSHLMSSEVRASPFGRLTPYEKIRLARQLSLAVLHFQSTPVMQLPWESGDVVFFNSTLDSVSTRQRQRSSLEAPHLNVQMHKCTVNGSPTSPEEQAFIRNPQLFGLAIVLLELAYQTSLQDLNSEFERANNAMPNSKLGNYVLADRLSRCMSEELGIAYKEVVRKCLTCDFGHGDDLSNSLLQAAFYEEVVCKLEGLEKLFEKIMYGT